MIDDVVNSVLTRIAALDLELPAGTALPAGKGKQPLQQAGPNTHLTVHPAQRPHSYRQQDTQTDLHTYRVTATLWKPGNRDNTADAAQYSSVIDAVVTTLDHQPSELAGLPGLFDVRAETGQYVDRGAWAKGWDVMQVNVEVQIVRAR